MRGQNIQKILKLLANAYPQAETKLVFANPYQLLVAVILSARTTDDQVNRVTEKLFELYPSCEDLACADPRDLEQLIKSLGLYRAKARYLIETGRLLAEKYGGKVPCSREALESLSGVGRKTAGVLLGIIFGSPVLPVDTHVFRVAHRLGLSSAGSALKTEEELCRKIPPVKRLSFHHRLIAHGRNLCLPKKPRCRECFLLSLCPYGRQRNI